MLEKAAKLVYALECELEKQKTKANDTEAILEATLKDKNIVTEAYEILLKVSYIKKNEMKILTNVVNQGLKYAYPEKDLEFKIEFVESSNRIVPEFYLNQLKLKSPFAGDGGGIISMISLLIYITFVKLKKAKVVLLDEADAMVDIEASDRLFQFLDVFARDNNITIIVITHKQLDYANEYITENIKMLKV